VWFDSPSSVRRATRRVSSFRSPMRCFSIGSLLASIGVVPRPELVASSCASRPRGAATTFSPCRSSPEGSNTRYSVRPRTTPKPGVGANPSNQRSAAADPAFTPGRPLQPGTLVIPPSRLFFWDCWISRLNGLSLGGTHVRRCRRNPAIELLHPGRDFCSLGHFPLVEVAPKRDQQLSCQGHDPHLPCPCVA
jgi:hypothetical protein